MDQKIFMKSSTVVLAVTQRPLSHGGWCERQLGLKQFLSLREEHMSKNKTKKKQLKTERSVIAV